jgi:sugar/nucleoside kinase (ribokinase family)
MATRDPGRNRVGDPGPGGAAGPGLDEALFRGRRLCVVGNLSRDLRTAPFPAGEGLLRDGETAVDAILETIGGGGANSACAAAALGATVTLLAKVGADALGRRLEETLRRHGVHTSLARDPALPTGTSLGLSYASGQRHFLSSLPASRSLTFADLDLAALAGQQHLLRADIWFSEPMLLGGNGQLLRAARQAGVPTSIDLNWDPGWGHLNTEETRARKRAVREVLPWVDLAHGNVRELTEFAEAPDLDTALRRLTDWGTGAVVVHLGAQGAGYYERGTLAVEPAVPASRQVNATGTGDVLSVCMMLLHGAAVPVRQKLRLANAVVTQYLEGRRALVPALTSRPAPRCRA